MAEFQWWLLLVGLVAGGGLVAVVFLDGARREQDIEDAELPAEANWIAERLASRELKPRDIEAILREHREYRLMPPPDGFESIEPPPDAAAVAAARAAARAQSAARTRAADPSLAADPGTPPAEASPKAPATDA